MSKSIFKMVIQISACILLLNHAISANGTYIGFSLGGSKLNGNSNLLAHRNNPAGIVSQNQNSKLDDASFHGDLFAGYGQFVDQIWLAGEAHVGLSALETETILQIANVDIAPTAKVKSSHNSGLSFHVGYQVNESTKAYLKLGAEIRKFSTNFTGKSVVGDNLIEHSKNFYSVGFVPGFGVETVINPDLVLRTEYKAALHRTKSHRTNGSNSSFTSLKTKPSVHQVSLGLNFKI